MAKAATVRPDGKLIGDGRAKDAREVALHRKAQQIGLMLLGELSTPLMPISEAEIRSLPRMKLRVQRDELRAIRKQLEKFCRENFPVATIAGLAELHDEVLSHESKLRLPLVEFEHRFGRLPERVRKGSPTHATVQINPLGLQFDFPEMHHIRDLATAFAEVLESRDWYEHNRSSWRSVLDESRDPASRQRISRYRFALRMTMLVCFNLVESYVNGVAFEFIQGRGTAGLSTKDVNLLTECDRPVNTVEKLIKVPRIVGGHENPPLHDSREPLRQFVEFVKPYRDSIVHASPFAAPDRFGGYDKLEKFLELDGEAVTKSVQTTLRIVSVVHRSVGGLGSHPRWVDDFWSGPFKRNIEPWFKDARCAEQ